VTEHRRRRPALGGRHLPVSPGAPSLPPRRPARDTAEDPTRDQASEGAGVAAEVDEGPEVRDALGTEVAHAHGSLDHRQPGQAALTSTSTSNW